MCVEAECDTNPDAPLLICEGSCQRIFHTPCVGLTEAPEGTWLCEECLAGAHKCSGCGEVGKDNVFGGVVKCSRKNCGLYFHESCVRNYNIEEDEAQAKRAELARRKASDEGGEEPEYEPLKFVCPAHFCWTCGDVPKNERATKTKKGELFRCLHCPISYHVDCISPLANFHELAMVCHEHSTYPLPSLPSGASVLNKGRKTKTANEVAIPKVLNNFVGLEAFDALPKHEGFTVPPMILPKEVRSEVVALVRRICAGVAQEAQFSPQSARFPPFPVPILGCRFDLLRAAEPRVPHPLRHPRRGVPEAPQVPAPAVPQVRQQEATPRGPH